MPSALITAKGQTTIPKAIRERLGLEPGERVDFVVQADGTVKVEPAQGVTPLKGLLAVKGRRPVSVEAMHAAIRKRATRR